MGKLDTVTFDRTELVIEHETKNRYETLNISYNQIIRIDFEKYVYKRLFKKEESERIILLIRGREEPLILTKRMCGQNFNEIKSGMKAFAKENKLTMFDKSC